MPARTVRVEADGGSRGNPGPAAYGAVLLDAATGAVIAERAETIGVATNNVAEYRGLVAGLELAREHAPDATVEVHLDSKLVVEQMSGRWKVKHADLKPLVEQARGLAPAGTSYAWMPRERNTHADRILNEALDGSPTRTSPPTTSPTTTSPITTSPTTTDTGGAPARGWSPDTGVTTLVLVRHGVTEHTLGKRFSSGLGGSNPGLNDEGRDQVRATADWLSPLGDGIDAVVTSPVRRTQESAEIIGARLGRPVLVEDGLAEMEFGTWDGLTYGDVHARWPDELDAWLGSLDAAPGGGESFRTVEKRVLASRDRLIERHAGQTVLAVSHVTPIKVLVTHVLGAPLEAVYRMELAPASVTVLSYFADGNASMRMFNGRPTEVSFRGR